MTVLSECTPDLVKFAENVARKWARKTGLIQLDEAESIAMVALAEALDKYNSDRGDLYGWVYGNIWRRVVDHVRAERGRYKIRNLPTSLDAFTQWNDDRDGSYEYVPPQLRHYDTYGEGRTEPPELAVKFREYMESIRETNKRWYHIARLRIAGKDTFYIAELFNVTSSRISQGFSEMLQDFQCWNGQQACGRRYSCTRCRPAPKPKPVKERKERIPEGMRDRSRTVRQLTAVRLARAQGIKLDPRTVP